MKKISIIDCAVQTASHNCFNRLTDEFNRPFYFHNPAMFSTDSLKRVKADGHIIFGSYSNVYEKLDWQVELSKLMKSEIEKGVPVLGICFGHQLMAEAFGGKVGARNLNVDGLKGSREVEILIDKFGFKKDSKKEIFVAHRFEVKEMPDCFVHLAKSEDCFYDGLAHESLPYFSFQGHPEASDYFAHNTIGKDHLDHQREGKAYKDGLSVIESFINLVDSI
jgi:GMP synthase (glutamine-hydrolysing)